MITCRKQAFTIIAEAFDSPVNKRTKFQRELGCSGMCKAIKEMDVSEYSYSNIAKNSRQDVQIPRKLASEMKRFLRKIQPCSRYWIPAKHSSHYSRENDGIRASFCYMVAELSDKDYNAILQGKKK